MYMYTVHVYIISNLLNSFCLRLTQFCKISETISKLNFFQNNVEYNCHFSIFLSRMTEDTLKERKSVVK